MADVYPMMHLVNNCDVKSKDVMYQTLTKVYHNFTSIYKAVGTIIDEHSIMLPEDGWVCEGLRQGTGLLVTFWRYMLGRIFEEDGITITPRFCDLLTDIELLLVDIVKDSRSFRLLEHINTVSYELEKNQKVYSKPPPIDSYQLIINYDMMIEFLQGFERGYYVEKVLIENIILLRTYFELLSKDPNQDDNLEMMIHVEKLVFEMAKHCALREDNQRFRRLFLIGVLKALVWHSDGFNRSAEVMSDELLIGYLKCIQDNLGNLLNNEEIDVSGTLKSQLMYLDDRLSFMSYLLFTYPLKHNSELEKLRLDFQALSRSVGSVICSYYDSPKIDGTSLGLFDLIKKANAINEEIIKLISVMILQDTERESPKKDQLGSLIILLHNLKEFMDYTPGLVVTWRDHENLVLFIFYLYQNNIRGGIHSGTSLITHEELEGILVSAQVVAFNMAIYSLLETYGKFCWSKLYLKKQVDDKHLYSRILEAVLLSSTIPLTDELLTAYGECVQDCLIKLLSDKVFDSVKDHFNILHRGFSFLWRLLINYRDEEKLSHIKEGFQDLMRSLGSEVCSCFNNWLRVDMVNQSNVEPSQLVDKMNLMIVEAEELLHLVHINKIGQESPKTNKLSSFNLILQNWNGLVECESDLMITWKGQFQIIHENLIFLKTFITSSSSTKDDESKNLCSSIMDAGYVAEYLITTFYVGICPARSTSLWISEFIDHLERIKANVIELKKKNCFVKEISIAGNDQVFSQASQVPTLNDVFVGFKVEMKLIREKNYAPQKQLDVISIVGMPGLGKTTLAKKFYDDSSTIKHFDARAWCTISQDYNKRKLLLSILGSMIQLTDELTEKNDDSEISVMIHKQLKGRRYFIVLDDIWDIKAFMDIKNFFPDDNNRSRVMLTSRSKEIGSQAQRQSHGNLIEPGLLTDEQSWDLLAQKVYKEKKCPDELCQIGKDIAKKCQGLPLGVVVVGGVLAKGLQEKNLWERVLENLSMYLVRDSQSQFNAALELSYEYLPNCLKPMFLYLGVFPEDAMISPTKLMRIWRAEGFLPNTKSTSLESQAEKSLMDLIDRSLVMVDKRWWDGRVKICHVHDTVRDMCLRKAKEENFMQQVRIHAELWYQRRLSIYLERDDEITSIHSQTYKDLSKFAITSPTCSLLFFHAREDKYSRYLEMDLKPVISSMKLLKVFDADICRITQDVLDKDLIMLVHLRYLSVAGANLNSITSSISRLKSLETLIITTGGSEVTIPETIWEMSKLRDMHIGPNAKFSAGPENSFILDNLQTFSCPKFDIGEDEKIFKKVANLKELSCVLQPDWMSSLPGYAYLPNYECLGKLESLVVDGGFRSKGVIGQLKLAITLKKLTIRGLKMKWSQIIFHTLPNLEYLKLDSNGVDDIFWDMGDDDILTKLKVLKIRCESLERWSASSENFPCLEKLVLDWCSKLEEIPELGEFYSLHKIKVKYCKIHLVNLVEQIQQDQKDIGNDDLKCHFKYTIPEEEEEKEERI